MKTLLLFSGPAASVLVCKGLPPAELPDIACRAIRDLQAHLQGLDERIDSYDRELKHLARADENARRVQTIPGIGPITASAIVASVGSAKEFRNGRQFAAWLGLTPRQSSSGGKTRLGHISKRGDAYPRTLLILGARSVLQNVARHADRLSRWARTIRGRWHYLYRAVDKHGKAVDFLLRRDRGIAAAQAFFRKALGTVAPRVPWKITLDGHAPSPRALWLLRREHRCWRNVEVRTNRYLNNIIEQDHRAIKLRCASMAGFKSFASAAVTISGIELAHRIRKRQFMLSRTYRRLGRWSLAKEWSIALA